MERSSTYPKFEEIRVPSLYNSIVKDEGPVHDTLVVVGYTTLFEGEKDRFRVGVNFPTFRFPIAELLV